MSPSATLDVEYSEVSTANANAMPDRWVKVKSYDPGFEEFFAAQFARLRALQPGWDGYHAVAIDGEVLNAVERLLQRLKPYLAARPVVVPLTNGTLQLEWHDGNKVLELEFENANTIHYLKWNPDAKVEDESFIPAVDADGIRALVSWFGQAD